MKCASCVKDRKHYVFTALKVFISKNKMYLLLPDSLLIKTNIFSFPRNQI